MSFVSVPGLTGKVYAPDGCRQHSKKYPCKDCFSCQQCSDDRCRVCLSRENCCGGKLDVTIKETITHKKVNTG